MPTSILDLKLISEFVTSEKKNLNVQIIQPNQLGMPIVSFVPTRFVALQVVFSK